MTTGQQMDLLTHRIVHDAIDAVKIEARLREVVADAIEAAPRVAAWWRHRTVLVEDQEYPLIWFER